MQNTDTSNNVNSSTDYRVSHLNADKGVRYHAEFSSNPYRSMVWEMEKSILDRILNVFYKSCQKRINHLDFACGTGRILAY